MAEPGEGALSAEHPRARRRTLLTGLPHRTGRPCLSTTPHFGSWPFLFWDSILSLPNAMALVWLILRSHVRTFSMSTEVTNRKEEEREIVWVLTWPPPARPGASFLLGSSLSLTI